MRVMPSSQSLVSLHKDIDTFFQQFHRQLETHFAASFDRSLRMILDERPCAARRRLAASIVAWQEKSEERRARNAIPSAVLVTQVR